jgi:hypothetical protein
MTNTTSVIGNQSMSRVFSASSTDSTYFNQVDSVTGTAIGLSMPNQTISYLCSTTASGTGLWRIISSTTNKIHRQGVMSKTGYVVNSECSIVPLRIQPDMLFQCYVQPDNSGVNESNLVALVYSNRGVEAFQTVGSIDGDQSPLVSIISGLGVGNLLFGSTISRIEVAGEFGMALDTLTVIDAASGNQYTGYGNYRLPTAGGTSTQMNGVFNMTMPVQKGWVVNVQTTTAV